MSTLDDRWAAIDPVELAAAALEAPRCECVHPVFDGDDCAFCGKEIREPGTLGREFRAAAYDRRLRWARGAGLHPRTGFRGLQAEVGPNPALPTWTRRSLSAWRSWWTWWATRSTSPSRWEKPPTMGGLPRLVSKLERLPAAATSPKAPKAQPVEFSASLSILPAPMETSTAGDRVVMPGGTITFSYDDPDGALAGVRLAQERELTKDKLSLDFARGRDSDAWRLRLPRPDVDRMEYLLELVAAGGGTRLVCDPANPLRARGPFGEKSVVQLPSYRPPTWLANGEPPKGEVVPLGLQSPRFRTSLNGLLWSSPGSAQGEPLPLLVVHDGPEYAEYSSLLKLLDAMAGTAQLPPMRAALLAPEARNRDYSASPRYAAALSRNIIPALGQLAPTPDGAEMRIGMGSSLGALAMLHSHRRDPGTFGGLFLQSASFFRRGTREQEWDFTRQRRITGFVGEVLAASDWDDPIPITMTCGRLEDNLENNRAMRDALAAQGYEVSLNVTRDLHNWVAWRDGFDPHLVALLRRAWA